jgi:hypothetical protein
MAIANSDFKVRNGLVVSGNTTAVGNVVMNDNLTVDEKLVVSGTLHTVAGNSNYGSSTLHINATDKRAIINASSTSVAADTTDWAFEVNGKFKTANNALFAGTTQFNDDVTIGGDGNKQPLVVWGDTTLKANVAITGNTTISGNSVTIGSGTTPNTVIEGNVWIKGTIKTGDQGQYYDLDDLNSAVGGVPILKVYNVGGTQVFP